MAWGGARFRVIQSLRRSTFALFIRMPMARDEKRVVLRTVDDEVVREPEVVRLYNRETEPRRHAEAPVRLGPQVPQESPSRLEIAGLDELELRTHQPGIEVLIEPDVFNPDLAEQAWGEDSKRHLPIPWGWFVLIGMAIVSAVTWSLFNLSESEGQAQAIRTETVSALAEEEVEEAEARELVERIENTLRIYFDATTVDLLARFVRHPERVKPLMRDYYERKPLAQSPMRSLRALQPLTLDNYGNFWMGSVMLVDGRLVNLVMEIDANGQPRIDWETQVCYQPMPWDDFARQRPSGQSMDFRVYAERDNFHSHEFADSEKWHCFRLTALDSDETLFGYVAAGSATARLLEEATAPNPHGRASLILRLAIPHGVQSRRGVMIEKMTCARWLHINPPAPGS
jgi:hypothetical protein